MYADADVHVGEGELDGHKKMGTKTDKGKRGLNYEIFADILYGRSLKHREYYSSSSVLRFTRVHFTRPWRGLTHETQILQIICKLLTQNRRKYNALWRAPTMGMDRQVHGCYRRNRQRDRRTDTGPLHVPCSALHSSSVLPTDPKSDERRSVSYLLLRLDDESWSW